MSGAMLVMIKRQIKLYIRNKQRLISSLVQPMLFLVAFGFGIGGMYSQAGNGDYIQYLIPGIIGMTLMMSSTMNGMSLIWDKQFGFLKETLVAPVSRTVILFGRCTGGALTSTFQGILILFMSIPFGFRITNWAILPLALIFMFFISLLFNLFGTSLASKFDDFHAFPTVMNFLVMPMFFLSGALFPVENFPAAIRVIAVINPFTYCINMLKYTLGSYNGPGLALDAVIIVVLIILIGSIGKYLFDKIET